MIRTLVALVVGIALGATATWLLRDGVAARSTLSTLLPAVTTDPALGSREPNDEAAAAALSPRDFERAIEQRAAERPSPERDFELSLLLSRYSGLDAARAATLASEVGAHGATLAALYSRWASSDGAAALAALPGLDDPSDAADAALALVVTFGADAAALERVAAVLAELDPTHTSGFVQGPFGPVMTPAVVLIASTALCPRPARRALEQARCPRGACDCAEPQRRAAADRLRGSRAPCARAVRARYRVRRDRAPWRQ